MPEVTLLWPKPPEHGCPPTVYFHGSPMRGVLESLLRWFSPFRLMKDAGCGTSEERIAAYRYNRRRRSELTACMCRWACALVTAALLTAAFDALGGSGVRAAGMPEVLFVYLSAACATFLVCGLCVFLITAYVYVYLTSREG